MNIGIEKMLSKLPFNHIIDEAGNAKELMQKVRTNDYTLLILDISMPGRSGIDVLSDVNSVADQLPILILSMHSEEQYAVRALRAGASGYLNKESASLELLVAVQKILSGGKYLSSSMGEKLVDMLNYGHDEPLHQMLSNREYEVFQMLATCRMIKEIAKDLFLSHKTVSTYKSRIMKKLSLKSQSELVRYAIREGIVE